VRSQATKAERERTGVERPTSWRRVARAALRALEDDGLLEDATVILVGSFARGAPTWRSDVDILVISPRVVRSRPAAPPIVELHFQTPERFMDRIASGDDFAQWAVRFGILLCDAPGRWSALRKQLEDAPFPDWARKLPGVQRHVERARALLAMADVDAACEQAMRAADHLGRSLLLQREIWPLSRPELPAQLHGEGFVELSRALDALGGTTIAEADLLAAIEVIEHELASVSPDLAKSASVRA
jgi:hypothetical protein